MNRRRLSQPPTLQVKICGVGDLMWRKHTAGADPENWTVIVDRYSPEGSLVDGPQILIVNGATGEVRTFESYYE